ncbi:MAG: hypothetical protein HOP03_05965 [Lysobacter sp.]|nr:hypothetical protein [Lysobacter sp.]
MSESMRALSALADLSVAELTTLTPLQTLHAVEHLEAATAGLDALRRKLDAALNTTYGEHVRRACAEACQDVGLVHIDAGEVRIRVEITNQVVWDQTQLAAMAARIAKGGERVEAYLDITYHIPETRWSHWPPTLRTSFARARLAMPGAPTYRLSPRESV